MMGMELDFLAFLRMDRVTKVTGFVQIPICTGITFLILSVMHTCGFTLAKGEFAFFYTSVACSFSSSIIVTSCLIQQGKDTPSGRLTGNILFFQHSWAIVVLALQHDLHDMDWRYVLRTFAFVLVLIVVALAYSKYVMPPVLHQAKHNVELMLVICLCWCFFVCSMAILPFVRLTLELAALIAGAALATFPYSADVKTKIKYIRDFFITLFFAGLGMQIPLPTPTDIGKGLLCSLIVILFRPLGIWVVVMLLGGGGRLATISTINLSQMSEFALVICSIGMTYGHVESDTMTIVIWTFTILAVAASYMIGYNTVIFELLERCVAKCLRREVKHDDEAEGGGHGHEEADIVLLGFHKVASMLVAEFQARNPAILKRLHIIDVNQNVTEQLQSKGIKCSYGDFTVPDVLEHCHHGEARIIISSIPNSNLNGTDNMKILHIVKQVWPDANVIVTADNADQAKDLYQAGADYVLRINKLCSERLSIMLRDNFTQEASVKQLTEIFAQYRLKDKDYALGGKFMSVKV